MNRYFEVNGKGHNIRCKLYARDTSGIRRVVLCLHGFGGHKDNKATERFAERVLSKTKDVAVVAFNWPCHGDDVKKKFSLADCYTYLELVTEYAKEQWKAEALYALAISFGGYVLLNYIADRGNPFRKVVLRSPAVPMYQSFTETIMTDTDAEQLSRGRDAMVGFDRKVPVSPAFLEEIRTADLTKREFFDWADDLLIIHGTADEIISFEEIRAFSENNVIELVPVEGADHRFQNPLKMDAMLKTAMDFYAF